MSEEDWDEVIAVHMKGTFACSKFAAIPMSQQQNGRVINLTSGSAWSVDANRCNYSAAKAGIIGLTYELALELARYNITVNAVRPQALTRMIPSSRIEDRLQRAKEETKRTNAPEPSLIDIVSVTQKW